MSELQPPRQSRAMVWSIVATAIVVTGVFLWVLLRGPDTAKYAPLIRAAENHSLPRDTAGTIDLSTTFPGLTANNQMYLRRWPEGRFAAFFPQYTAPGPAIAGLLYVSAPLQPDDTYRFDNLINFEKPMIQISTWRRLRIDRRLDDHWYRVSYGLE